MDDAEDVVPVGPAGQRIAKAAPKAFDIVGMHPLQQRRQPGVRFARLEAEQPIDQRDGSSLRWPGHTRTRPAPLPG